MIIMWVTKANGKIEKFDEKKIKRTCIRAGASKELAQRIVNQVRKRSYDGISTREVLQITLRLLNKEIPQLSVRYDLKGAMLRLGPGGFPFERFVAEVLREYGFITKINKIVKGASVNHELDIFAAKPIKAHRVIKEPKYKYFMIECKFHNSPGVYTGLKDVLYSYARFLDLRDAYKIRKGLKFDQAWLVTNTKFSRDAIKYANSKNIKLLGWRYPTGNSLEEMIESKKLYPITSLRKLNRGTQGKLAQANLMLVKDLIRYDINRLMKKTGISKRVLKELIAEAEKLLA